MTTRSQEISRILDATADEIALGKAKHEAIETLYHRIGEHLAADITLANYDVIISPQGSLKLGTAIEPIDNQSDVDIDLVCELSNYVNIAAQSELKILIGQSIANYAQKKGLMIKEGKRCWTLNDGSNRYHIDVLPSISSAAIRRDRNLLESNLTLGVVKTITESDVERISIRYTDKLDPNYNFKISLNDWPKSNPFGYALWFENQGQRESQAILAAGEVKPVPKYRQNKTELQDIVILLKRHRDVMFYNDGNHKPISIIITTLAAKFYGADDLFTSKDLFGNFTKVVKAIYNFHQQQKGVPQYVIKNPINRQENFADKWIAEPEYAVKFNLWITELCNQVRELENQSLDAKATLAKMFNSANTNSLPLSNAIIKLSNDKSGITHVNPTTGGLGNTGKEIKPHKFYGK